MRMRAAGGRTGSGDTICQLDAQICSGICDSGCLAVALVHISTMHIIHCIVILRSLFVSACKDILFWSDKCIALIAKKIKRFHKNLN